MTALRSGVVAYSTASGSGANRGVGPRDLQGTWQVGATLAGATQSQRFVLRAAPNAGSFDVTFSFQPGNPSDGSRAIATSGPGAWSVQLPGTTRVRRGSSATVRFSLAVPSSAAPGSYTGSVRLQVSNGQTLRIPVYASVALHDPNRAEANPPGPQGRVTSAHDVFGKDNTTWPSALGAAGGATADWLVYPVELASGLTEARFSVYDSDQEDETYDLYVYDANLDLLASTHPFLAPGVTNTTANDARGPSTQASPQVLSLATPEAGRHYLAVNRAKIGGTTIGDFGSFALTLDVIGGGGGGGGGCDDADEDDEDGGGGSSRVNFSVAAPLTASPGSNMQSTTSYHNHDDDDEEDCEIDNELHGDTAFVSASDGGVYDPARHAVTWNLGTVAAGESGSVSVIAQVSPFALPGTVLLNQGFFGSALPRTSAFAETLVLP